MESWIETYPKRRRVNIFDFKIEDIQIEDIAKSLSNQCRFNGHCKWHYSIAQHSVYVYDILKKKTYDPKVCFAGLMHDAAEAYIGDIPTPIKHQLPIISEIEKKIMRIISQKYHFEESLFEAPAIQETDKSICLTEAIYLGLDVREWSYLEIYGPIPDFQIESWTSTKAEVEFLSRFFNHSFKCEEKSNEGV